MYKRDENFIKSIELIFMKCLSIRPRGKNPSKSACSTIKFKTCGCPLAQFYSLSMRQARCIKTGRCFWLCTGGRRVKVYQIYSHTHRAALGHLGFGIFLKDAMTGRLREPWIERWPSYMYNCHLGVNCCANQLWKHGVWDSSVGLRGVIVGNKQSWQVMTSLQSSSSWRL